MTVIGEDGRPVLVYLVCGEAHGETVAVQPVSIDGRMDLPRWCDWKGSRYVRWMDSRTFVHHSHTSEGQSASSDF